MQRGHRSVAYKPWGGSGSPGHKGKKRRVKDKSEMDEEEEEYMNSRENESLSRAEKKSKLETLLKRKRRQVVSEDEDSGSSDTSDSSLADEEELTDKRRLGSKDRALRRKKQKLGKGEGDLKVTKNEAGNGNKASSKGSFISFKKKQIFRDPHSQSNLHEIQTKNMSLRLELDFNSRVLIGSVELLMEATVDDLNEVVLDTSGDLAIVAVYSLPTPHANSAASQNRRPPPPEKATDLVPLSFSVEEPRPCVGSALRISLPSALEKGDTVLLRIQYRTSPEATGLMWLSRKQTEGKHYPYFFTQFSRINARSAIPCQDSPSVKFPYQAQITAPKPLRALMGAKSLGKTSVGNVQTHSFEQPMPVPAFLISLVVGDLYFNDISSRCRLWSERDPLEAAVREFTEIEVYLKAAERIMQIPYKWGRYDIVVLPGSYPFGFIESTSLTMITPTLLAGDKSLTYLLAHAVAHGWMGSLVTNKTWEHAWLNEGFAVYLERKILEQQFGKQRLGFHAISGRNDWEDAIIEFRNNDGFTKMIPDLSGVSPEFFIGPVQYERGFQFLWYLQDKVVESVPAFEKFMKTFIEGHIHQSITSKDFKDAFCTHFAYMSEKLASVDWDMWFYKTGIPSDAILPSFDDSLLVEAEDLAQRWKAGGDGCKPNDIQKWSAVQIGYFLQELWNISAEINDPFTKEVLERMDECYHFSRSKNNDNLFYWYRLCLSAGMEGIFHNVVTFLGMQGRVKYLLPLYNELYRLENGKTLAQETFFKYKDYYENSTQHLLSKELGLPPPMQPVPEYEANAILKEIIASQKQNWIKEKVAEKEAEKRVKKEEKRKEKENEQEKEKEIETKEKLNIKKSKVKRKRAHSNSGSEDETADLKAKPKKGRRSEEEEEQLRKGTGKRKRREDEEKERKAIKEEVKEETTETKKIGKRLRKYEGNSESADEKQMDTGEGEASEEKQHDANQNTSGGSGGGNNNDSTGGDRKDSAGGNQSGGSAGEGSGGDDGGDKKRKKDEEEDDEKKENATTNKKAKTEKDSTTEVKQEAEDKDAPIEGDVSMQTTNGDADMNGDGDPGTKEDESDKDGEDAEEEEDVPDYREPIVDGRKIIFKTKILNEYLLCSLCMGYFRDAHTVKECLHTFCKSCLFKYFQTTADCPSCGVDLRPNPRDRIRFDRTLQNIVNKIFADIIEKDLATEAAFYRERGMIADAERVETVLFKSQQQQKPATLIEKPVQPKNRIKRDPSKPIYKDEVTFELIRDEDEESLGVLERPVIRTSARVTVRHLKKFLSMKLGIDAINLLDILYKGEVLGMEHSLEYILKTRGHEGSGIEFRYRKKRTEI